MKVEIEIDGSLIPDGYEAVAYRLINEGELYSHDYGEAVEADRHIAGNLELILKKKRWRAERPGEYWFVHFNGEIHKEIETGSGMDDDRFDVGNYFQTKEEAEKAAERVRKAYLGVR